MTTLEHDFKTKQDRQALLKAKYIPRYHAHTKTHKTHAT